MTKLETHEDVDRLLRNLRANLGIEKRRRDLRSDYGHKSLSAFAGETMQN